MSVKRIALLLLLCLFFLPSLGNAKLPFNFGGKHKKTAKQQNRINRVRCRAGITLSSKILFGFNSYSLKPDAIEVLESVCTVLRNLKHDRVVVVGYTDNIGSKEYNIVLSRRRAKAVTDYLIARGIHKSSIEVVGYGESYPAYPNDTEEHRALNRRVEIKVYWHCRSEQQIKGEQKELEGVVEVYKGNVYIVVNPACRCRESYRVLGRYKKVLKSYAGKKVKVKGKVKRLSPWSGEVYVEKVL